MTNHGDYSFYQFNPPPIVKPNRITGEGRMKYRPWSCRKVKDEKKKKHRKMARNSRRRNRG